MAARRTQVLDLTDVPFIRPFGGHIKQDFAKLIPHNALAEQLFSSFVDQFHVRTRNKEAMMSNRLYYQPTAPGSEVRFRGGFRLNLGLMSGGATRWTIGSASVGLNSVHFPVCLGPLCDERGISPRHAFISFSPDGFLQLTSETTAPTYVAPSGEILSKLRYALKLGDTALLLSSDTFIGIGDLVYRIEFQPWCFHKFFHEELTVFMRYGYPEWKSHPLQSYIYASDNERHKEYTISAVLGQSSAGSCHLAVMKTGEVLAVKKCKKEETEWTNELKNLKAFKGIDPASNWIIDLVHESQSDNHSYIFFKPLIMFTLEQVAHSSYEEFDYMSRMTMAAQLSDAIDWLHRNTFLHNDIKPANAALVSRQPPRICLHDLSSVTRQRYTTTFEYGTTAYLAPEVLDYITLQKATSWSWQADSWALGLSLSEIMHRAPQPRVTVTKSTRKWQIEIAGVRLAIGAEEPTRQKMFKSLLELDPAERPDCGFVSILFRKAMALLKDQPAIVEQLQGFWTRRDGQYVEEGGVGSEQMGL